ncbi:hypothetical protein [Caballeronia udeis]|uniref:hypothetical protein n=1 Tax=Caballeronia udeis TaxID=1232866 RepID=UPI001E42E39F|nr:hypothetical protein [Caballeronia udeis]
MPHRIDSTHLRQCCGQPCLVDRFCCRHRRTDSAFESFNHLSAKTAIAESCADRSECWSVRGNQSCAGYIDRPLKPSNDTESRTASAEEALQIVKSGSVVRERSRGCDDPQLVVIGMEAKAVQKHPKQVCDFRPRRAAVRVQFIDDEMKDVPAVRGEPTSGSIEYRRLDCPHQHDIKHAVVCDEDIGRLVLHVPPRPHFSAI